MATDKQLRANRENAKHSTGPRTEKGKQIVSANRISHGVLSNKLLLGDECIEDYQRILDDLHTQLMPVGTLEQALVEKIAVTLWRHRRLIRAETATIQLEANPRRIASLVETGLGFSGYDDDTIEVDDLQVPDQEQIDWYKAVIAEFNGVDEWNLVSLQQKAPLIYDQLTSDAELEEESVEQYLSGISLQDYLSELISWCYKELCKQEKRAKQHPAVVNMADTAKDKLCIPWSRLDLMNKYQTALDNQLYKAMKALRDAQEWRNSLIAADVLSVNVNDEPA